MKAKTTIQFFDGIVPAWIKHITYRLSQTGKTVVIDIYGMMDLRSSMPGGHKRKYITVTEFDLNPEGAINSAMHGAWDVQNRFYGSCAVHDAREKLSKEECSALAAKLAKAGLRIYKDAEAVAIVNKEISQK